MVHKSEAPNTKEHSIVKYFFNLIPLRKHNLKPDCSKLQLSRWRPLNTHWKRDSHDYKARQMIPIHYRYIRKDSLYDQANKPSCCCWKWNTLVWALSDTKTCKVVNILIYFILPVRRWWCVFRQFSSKLVQSIRQDHPHGQTYLVCHSILRESNPLLQSLK